MSEPDQGEQRYKPPKSTGQRIFEGFTNVVAFGVGMVVGAFVLGGAAGAAGSIGGVVAAIVTTVVLIAAGVFGFVIIVRKPNVGAKPFLLGITAGGCLFLLLVGLCFAALSNMDMR